MFRRKEEGLFDNATDSAEGQTDTTEIETPASAPAASTASSAPSAPTTGFGSAPQTAPTTGFSPAAPAASSRPNATNAPTASSFRPGAPATADLARNRLPEAKPAATTVSTTVDKSKNGGKRVLTVGNDILLKGEIATCDRLVIEGKVDATLNDVHTVEIAEGGSFKGSAQIEDAEISGLFEGDLTVRGRLVIYATGKVRGKISYGEIEIERGGEMSGEIKMAGTPAGAQRVKAA